MCDCCVCVVVSPKLRLPIAMFAFAVSLRLFCDWFAIFHILRLSIAGSRVVNALSDFRFTIMKSPQALLNPRDGFDQDDLRHTNNWVDGVRCSPRENESNETVHATQPQIGTTLATSCHLSSSNGHFAEPSDRLCPCPLQRCLLFHSNGNFAEPRDKLLLSPPEVCPSTLFPLHFACTQLLEGAPQQACARSPHQPLASPLQSCLLFYANGLVRPCTHRGSSGSSTVFVHSL